jgi:3-oxoacyl-[acyl-carrier-protein] synthase II
VSTACATGAHAIGDAFNLIRGDKADVMLCGGTESSINPLTIAAFARLRALSTKYNEEPQKASRPFDKNRDGFVMAEGAAILILESLERASLRNAPVLGEILGYGLTGDGHHLTAAREDGHGAFRAMKQALEDAQLRPEDVSYVNCHATSTPIGDKAEVRAMRTLFGTRDVSFSISRIGKHGEFILAVAVIALI